MRSSAGDSPGDAPKASAKKNQMPSLGGLRAISIALVIMGHLSGTHGFRNLTLGIGDYAHFGVVVFFAISGFLITSLLISEHAKRGRVSLKLFYARRALRIFPASYAYISCMWLLSAAGGLHLEPRDLWHAVTYTVNYQAGASWQFAHLWSLSIEEQFYLLWPFAFVALGGRRSTWGAAGVVLLAPVARAASWYFLRGTPYRDLEMFPMVADSLAMGCLLARLRYWLEARAWYMQLFRPVYSFGLLALVLLMNREMGYTIVQVFGTSVMNVSLAILIHRSVYLSEDRLGRFLNWKSIEFVGILSYSLYLWQQLFLNRDSTAWMNAFPQNLLFAVAAALASYLLLEKPLLRLRHRLRS
jgi:peptidoglycan/LPS O-acetylase OafA/YrhL